MKKLATIFILTIIVLCFTGCGDNKKLERQQKRIAELQQENEDLYQTISELDSERIELLSENDSLRIDLSDAQETVCYLLENDNSDAILSYKAEIEELKAELSKKDSEMQSIQQSKQLPMQVYPVGIEHSQLLYSLMFNPDPNGKRYEDKKPTWYSNPYCIEQTKINHQIVLICDTIIKWKLPNGTIVYTCRTVDNALVYSMEKPSLTQIN